MSAHTATITHDPESHAAADDCHDDCTATIACAGVTGTCRAWWECDTCRAARDALTDEQADAYDEDLWETSEAHGVEHQHIDSVWMTPSDECLAECALDNDARDLVDVLPDGEHPVNIDCEDGFVYVTADPVTADPG